MTDVDVTTPKDWATDQEVRWCPGCGDYSILTAMRMLMPDLGVRREDTVFVPYHWPGRKSINRLTSGHLDPVSKIPEFKVSTCRLEPTGRTAPSARETAAHASA